MHFNRRMMAFLLALPVQPTFAQQPGTTPTATVVGPICADQVSVPAPRRPRLILNPVQKLCDMEQEATSWLDAGCEHPTTNVSHFTRRDVASSAQ